MSRVLVLSRELARSIEEQGMRAYPDECCGIMYGRDEVCGGVTRRIVERLEAVANVFDESEKHHRFSIDPKKLMEADRQAAAEGKLVLGFYHSHPDHPAIPSAYDREHAWPFYSYVIVAIERGVAKDLKSYELDAATEEFGAEEVMDA